MKKRLFKGALSLALTLAMVLATLPGMTLIAKAAVIDPSATRIELVDLYASHPEYFSGTWTVKGSYIYADQGATLTIPFKGYGIELEGYDYAGYDQGHCYDVSISGGSLEAPLSDSVLFFDQDWSQFGPPWDPIPYYPVGDGNTFTSYSTIGRHDLPNDYYTLTLTHQNWIGWQAAFGAVIIYGGGIGAPELTPIDPNFKFTRFGNVVEAGTAGSFTLDGVQVTPGDEYIFSGWVYSEDFGSADANPQFLVIEEGRSDAAGWPEGKYIVDKWEYAVNKGWCYVYEDKIGPGGNFSHFIPEGNTVDMEIRLKGVCTQYVYGIALTDVTKGTVEYFDLTNFTPTSIGIKSLTAEELNNIFFPTPGDFTPVTDITGIPTSVNAGRTKLTGTVVPANATNKTINWSIKDGGTTGAYISGSALYTAAEGTVVVTATIVDGTGVGANYTQDFTIDITPAVVQSNDPNNAITMNGWFFNSGAQGAIFNNFSVLTPGHTYRIGIWVIGGGKPTMFVRSMPDIWQNSVEKAFDVDPDVWTFIYFDYVASNQPEFEFKFDCGYQGGATENTYFYGPSIVDLANPGVELLPPEAYSVNGFNRWTTSGGWAGAGEDSPAGVAGMYYDVSASELLKLFPTPRGGFVPVTDISSIPAKMQVGTHKLYNNLAPNKASIKDIIWSVKDAGTTGASVIGDMLTTTAAGTVVITATVVGGGEGRADFTKDFTIDITANDPYAPDPEKPQVFHIPFMQKPGDIGSIYGGQLQLSGGAAEVAIQPLSGFSGTLDPATAAYKVTAFNTIENMVQYEIPANIPYDVWAVWVKNDAGNWSDVQFVNKTEIYWVDSHNVYPGQVLTVMGRNMVNPTNRSADGVAVQFGPVGGGTALSAQVTDISDYTVTFKAPAGLAPGEKYDIRYTNGAGGTYGYANMLNVGRETVTAVTKNANIAYFDNKFNLNASFASTIDTSNIINIKDQIANWNDATANDAAQAVSDALASMGPNGGVLYFPEGKYTIDRIVLPNNVALIGDGSDKSVLTWCGGSANAGSPLMTSSATTVVICGLSLQNPFKSTDLGLSVAPVGNMIVLSNSSPAYTGIGGYALKDVTAINVHGAGVILSGPRPGFIDNSHIESYGSAVKFTANLQNSRILNSYLSCRETGLISNTCNYSRIEGCILNGDSRKYEAEQLLVAAYLAGDDPTKVVLPYPGMNASDSEHRLADVGGDECLYIGNTTTGTFGGKCDNCGEGFCMQEGQYSVIGSPVSATSTSLVTGKDLTDAIQRGHQYVQIVAGPGIGQVRNIAFYDNDNNGTIIIDNPWDVIPTAQTVYAIVGSLAARNVFADNVFNANMGSGEVYFYKSFDLTITNNQFVGGGPGIWFTAWGAGDSDQYYLNIYNNLFEGEMQHGTHKGSKVIGPGGSGAGIMAGGGNTTQIYGLQMTHNEMRGVSQNPQPFDPEDTAATWELMSPGWGGYMYNNLTSMSWYNPPKNGIYIGANASNNPNVWGTIIDGNKVTNAVNGIQMGAQDWDTVLRNNDFSGNKNNEVGVDQAANNQMRSGGRGSAGVETLAPIDKTALTLGILITSIETGNGQANVNFAIKSANGKGYSVYLSKTGIVGTFALYSDVNYNSKGVHIKGLENGVTYWVYIKYNDGNGNVLRSETVILEPVE